MKKILLFIFISFFLTGCTSEVTLKINDTGIEENIKLYDIKNKIYNNNILDTNVQNNLDSFEREFEYYSIKNFEENGIVGKTYGFNMSFDEWKDFSILRKCYDSISVVKNNSIISIYTSSEYRCGYMYGANDVTLILESNYEVRDSNADKIEGNKYIWYINSENYLNKRISINYKTLVDNTNVVSVEDVNNSNSIYYFFALIGVLIIVFGIYVYGKVKKSNE